MRIGLVSDVHWMAKPPASSPGWHGTGAEFRGVLERLRQALELFGNARVDVIALAGDLAHHGDEDSMLAVLEACAGVRAPVVVVSGNHDVAEDPERFGRAHGRADVPGVTLAGPRGEVLAGVRVAGVQVGETDGWFGASMQALPDIEAWGNEPTVLVSHYPALSLAADVSGHGFPYPGDLMDRSGLVDRLLERDGATIVVGGHVHARASRAESTVLQLTGGALVEAPYECAVIEIVPQPDGGLIVERSCRRLLAASGGREPVLAPESERWCYTVGQAWSLATRHAERPFAP